MICSCSLEVAENCIITRLDFIVAIGVGSARAAESSLGQVYGISCLT